MNNLLLVDDSLSIITGYAFVLAFVIFFVFSYLLVALLTWSFVKPFKYLSISFIVVGVFVLIFRLSIPSISSLILASENINLPTFLLPTLLKPFLNAGLISIFVGILFIGFYIFINKVMKKDNTDNTDNV